MNRNDITKLLKQVKPNAKLPSTLGYVYNEKEKALKLVVKSKGLKANMQDDAAAFDSWAIALKYYLKEYISTIIIDWERDFSKNLHYNRFVYRLAKFVQTYSWVQSAKPIPCIPSLLYCNIGSKEASDISKHAENSEGWLECKYVTCHSDEYDAMNHQFPVGPFDGKVSRDTHYTTGDRSAIDIWAIKGDCLSVFELKIPENKPLGIISELMFYTNVLDDIMAHRILYETNDKTQKAIKNNIRGFKNFYEAYSNGNIKRIESIFLADNLHSLLSKGLIDFINDSPRWKYKNIIFKHKTVNL